MSTADWAAHWAAKYDITSIQTRALARCAMLSSGTLLRVSVTDIHAANEELGASFCEALELLVAAGWLAPLEHLADGSLRTTLTIPEGV
jgi:hypothetical protein